MPRKKAQYTYRAAHDAVKALRPNSTQAPWTETEYQRARGAVKHRMRQDYMRLTLSDADVIRLASAAAEVASVTIMPDKASRPPYPNPSIFGPAKSALPLSREILSMRPEEPLLVLPLPVTVVADEDHRILSQGNLQMEHGLTFHYDGVNPAASYVQPPNGIRYPLHLSSKGIPHLQFVQQKGVSRLYDSQIPEHQHLDQIAFLIDGGAEAHVFGQNDADLLHELTGEPSGNIIGVGQQTVRSVNTGTFYLTVQPRQKPPRFPRGPGGGGGAPTPTDSSPTASSAPSSPKRARTVLPSGITYIARYAAPNPTPCLVVPARLSPAKGLKYPLRRSAYPPIRTAELASSRFNIFNPVKLKAFQAAVDGVTNFKIDDHADYGASYMLQTGVPPPTAPEPRPHSKYRFAFTTPASGTTTSAAADQRAPTFSATTTHDSSLATQTATA